MLTTESIAAVSPFSPIERHKWFSRFLAFTSFGKIHFWPPCSWNQLFMAITSCMARILFIIPFHNIALVWKVGARFWSTTLYLHRLTTRSACPPGLAGSRLWHAWWRKNRLFKVNTSCGTAGRSSFISGELKDGWDSICLWLTGVLLWPTRMPPWTASVHFPDSYPIDVFHISFNFLCLLLL